METERETKILEIMVVQKRSGIFCQWEAMSKLGSRFGLGLLRCRRPSFSRLAATWEVKAHKSVA